jgi:hypothetical protein
MQLDPRNFPLPSDLVQGLAAEATSRFRSETGCKGKVEIELRVPDRDATSFVVNVTVTDKARREMRTYDVVVRARARGRLC